MDNFEATLIYICRKENQLTHFYTLLRVEHITFDLTLRVF